MRVLVINAGSSSLKHALVDTRRETTVARGEERWEPDASAGRNVQALRQVLADAGAGAGAVGHRVVHGGARFTGPARVGAEVRTAIVALAPLAPVHTRSAVEGIDAAAAALPDVPQVACFDTAFHHTLRPRRTRCPANGTSASACGATDFTGSTSCGATSRPSRRAERCRRMVVCHLGSGCSVTAVLDGRSVDTTMGFTPLDGVPMATRSGSIDPGILLHLLASGVGADQLADALNHRSGLLGLSGHAGLREVQRAARGGDEQAQLAFDVFVRGV